LAQHYGTPDLGNLPDPLDELVFIVLSQMTTGPSYRRVFRRLHAQVGDWDGALELGPDTLAELIADAGLSRQKARRLTALFARLRVDFGHVTLDPLRAWSAEDAEQYLTGLPGVGVKTAKCVVLFSLGGQVLPVDTHIARVAQRLGLVNADLPARRVHGALEPLVAPPARHAFHVNALIHGQRVCRAVAPRCASCPVLQSCARGALEQPGLDVEARPGGRTVARS